MAASEPIFGIDLGTTNSCIAYVNRHGVVEVLPGDLGRVTPSVVFFQSKSERIVGDLARGFAPVYPDRVIELVKRNMGDPDWFTTQFGERWGAEAISAVILKKLVKDAREKSGLEVRDVVITVPASFNSFQCNATENAGKIAGLNVREIIREPAASAIAYHGAISVPDSVHMDADQYVLVYDLGGGTFDSCVINMKSKPLEVLTIEGDYELGGQGWDDLFADYLVEKWMEKTGYQGEHPFKDPFTLNRFLIEAERAKVRLTYTENVPVPLVHQGIVGNLEVTRQEFDDLTDSQLEATLEFTTRTLDTARNLNCEVSRILLTGGSSNMPQVTTALEKEFGLPVSLYLPEESVARGAALFAHDLSVGEPPPVRNICSKNFGLVVYQASNSQDRKVTYIIKKDSPVGFEFTRNFETHVDDKDVGIDIVESSGRELSDDVLCPSDLTGVQPYLLPDGVRKIARMSLQMPRGLPAGTGIDVTYYLSPDGGRLRTRAVEETEGRACEIQAIEVDALTEDQIDELRERLDDDEEGD